MWLPLTLHFYGLLSAKHYLHSSQMSLKTDRLSTSHWRNTCSHFITVWRANVTVYCLFKQNTFRFNRDSGERCWGRQRKGGKKSFYQTLSTAPVSLCQGSFLLSNKSPESVCFFYSHKEPWAWQGRVSSETLASLEPFSWITPLDWEMAKDFSLSWKQGGWGSWFIEILFHHSSSNICCECEHFVFSEFLFFSFPSFIF